MPSKFQPTYTKAAALIAALGDSHTLNYSYDVRQAGFYPALLADLLTEETGRQIAARNWGISGDTSRATTTGGSWTTATVGMLERVAMVTRIEVPKLVVLYCSSNDYTCISAGGAFPAHPGVTTTTVSSVVTLPSVTAIVDDLIAAGVERIVLVGYHVRNWASGGDVTAGVIRTEPSLNSDPGAVFGDSSRWANYQAYVTAAAAYPGKIAWCDLYAAFKTRLEAEAPAQIGVDAYLHVGTGNTHLNSRGEQWVADAIADTIVAMTGWITALTEA